LKIILERKRREKERKKEKREKEKREREKKSLVFFCYEHKQAQVI
jgi:hypothetical protein